MYVPQLSAFYCSIMADSRINARHISLYMALFECWNKNNFQSPVSIKRHDIMQAAKISGFATYHKCMKELHEYGYIKYIPSFDPGIKSKVHFNFFQQAVLTQKNIDILVFQKNGKKPNCKKT